MNLTVRQIVFQSTNGKGQIYGWVYLPGKEPEGVVQICHGMSEHMGRYHEFMRFLAQKGYAACGIDHIGHGRSANEGELGFFGEEDGWKTLIEDQYKFYKIVKTEVPGELPRFLLGHSMGSFIARLYAAKYPRSLQGLLLSGTGRGGWMLDLAQRMAARSIKKNGPKAVDRELNKLVFAHYNDHFRPAKTHSDWLSRSSEWVRQYIDDPKCGFVFTSAAFRDLFTLVDMANQSRCFDGTPKDLPVLIFSGTEDPVGNYGKGPTQVYQRYVKAGLSDVELTLYDGGRHEMLGEINREQVWEHLLNWLGEHAAFPVPPEECMPLEEET